MRVLKRNWPPLLIGITIICVIIREIGQSHVGSDQPPAADQALAAASPDSIWVAPNLNLDNETTGKEREMVTYGQNLIGHTAVYYGPRGTLAHTSNGMNCQNCHLDAGSRPWGNNYSAVFSTYPQYRSRSNALQDIYGRVNDCFERSLNGSALDTGSYEMHSIYAYMRWLGKAVAKGRHPPGSGLPKLPLPDHAADPQQGKGVYINLCQSCHGDNGQGFGNAAQSEFIYPPLWGEHSYNDGAGLYRLSNFASFVSNNMPFNQASHGHPRLTDQQAWNVAAFVNSQPRPHFDQHRDWPDVSKKPFDAPFGPYADSFPERQHKYGPFQPIISAVKSK